jgi:hypothetical protein
MLAEEEVIWVVAVSAGRPEWQVPELLLGAGVQRPYGILPRVRFCHLSSVAVVAEALS